MGKEVKKRKAESAHEKDRRSHNLRKYIRKFAVQEMMHGQLCEWKQSRRQVGGLDKFFHEYPCWARIVSNLYQKLDDDVSFSLHDCEKAMKGMKVEDYHYEALKIYNLLAAVYCFCFLCFLYFLYLLAAVRHVTRDAKDENDPEDEGHEPKSGGEYGDFSAKMFQQFTQGAAFLTSESESETQEPLLQLSDINIDTNNDTALAGPADTDPRAVQDLIDSIWLRIVN